MDISSSHQRIIRFGMFEADLSAGELRKSGLKIKIQEIPLRVVACLLEQPADVNTREELREALWGRSLIALGAVATILSSPHALWADDWPRFRGPNGSGVSKSDNLPSHLGASKDALWRVKTPVGKSSPIISRGRIFLTGNDGDQRLTLCVDAKTGALLWRQQLRAPRMWPHHEKGDSSAPTPVSDGQNVYVFFPDIGLLSYGLKGGERWRVPLGPFESVYGTATSPILAGNKVILKLDQISESVLAAYSTHDGELVWRTERGESSGAYSTPILLTKEDEIQQVLVPGSLQLASYDVRNGDKLWWVSGLSASSYSGPVADQHAVYLAMAAAAEPVPQFEDLDQNNDGIFAPAEAPPGIRKIVAAWAQALGNRDGQLDKEEFLRVRARLWSGRSVVLSISWGGTGDRTEDAIRWKYFRGFPQVPSPLLYDGLLYLLKDGGILTALDPATGEAEKVGRLRDAIDSYYASPVAGDGKIYTASETGMLSVIKAGTEWRVMSTTDLDESIYATPAIADDRIYVRTERSLYAFGR